MWIVLALVSIGLVGSAAWAAPPRWAPAHGRRRQTRVVRRVVAYTPAPFIYSGVTYVPLRDVTSLIGAALLWDSLDGRATFMYNGQDFALVVGSPTVFYGGQTVVLPAAPILVEDVVYVPSVFIERYVRLPVRHVSGRYSIEGPHGWHDFIVAPKAPRRVSFGGPVRSPFRAPAAREKTHPSIRRLPGPNYTPGGPRAVQPRAKGGDHGRPATRPTARQPQQRTGKHGESKGKSKQGKQKGEGEHGR